MRLGVLLTALVGINVYVFFFNRGTAPREVLNLQSTSKTFEARSRRRWPPTPQGGQAGRVGVRRRAPAGAPAAKPPRRPPSAGWMRRCPRLRPRPRRRAPAAPQAGGGPRRRRGGRAAGDSHPVRAAARPGRSRAPAPRTIADPVRAAARRRRRGSRSQGQQAVEKQFAAADTLGQVLAREGFGAAGPQRHRRADQAGRPAHDPRRRRNTSCAWATTARPTPSSTSPRPRSATSSSARTAGRRASRPGPRASWRRPSRSRRSQAGGVVESSLYESVQKSGESTALVSLLVELFAWDVNFYIDTHPGDHWKVVVEKQYLGGQFYKYGRVLAAEYGGKVGTFRAFYWAGKDAPPRSPRQVLRRKGAGGLQDDAEDAAALRAHQLEVRSQAPAPDPARRARAPGHRLRGAGRHAGLGVGRAAGSSRPA